MIISIIIPYFKNAGDIKRTMESVLNQTFHEFEVLIINDGSPDWNVALSIISKLDDNRIKTISHDINKNASAARNTGIKVAKGKYIAFLDADDEWYPNHLKDSLEFIAKNNYDLSASKVKLINQNGIFISPKEQLKKGERIATFLFVKGMSMYTPTLVCTSALAKHILFDESIKRHQDFDFLLRSESENYLLGTSPHLGAIVHWEQNNPIQKGETWKFSLEWLKDRSKKLNRKEYDNFWLQFVGFKILNYSKKLFWSQYLKNKISVFNLNRSRIKSLTIKMMK